MKNTPKTNVIQLLDKCDYVWRCECGNCGFSLHENGRVQCCRCDEYQEGPAVELVPKFQLVKRRIK